MNTNRLKENALGTRHNARKCGKTNPVAEESCFFLFLHILKKSVDKLKWEGIWNKSQAYLMFVSINPPIMVKRKRCAIVKHVYRAI